MQKSLIVLALCLSAMLAFAQQATPKKPAAPAASAAKKPTGKTATSAAKTQPAPAMTTTTQKFSYAVGMNVGTTLKQQSVDVDPNLLMRGLKDALSNAKPAMTEQEARAVLMQVRAEVQKKQMEKMQAMGAENKKAGEAFLTANKTKPGVVTLPSGLQYKIVKEGTGPKPTAADTVVCNYRGTLLDGKEFDASEKHGGPATFPVGGVIKGWTEALQLMPVGSKWQLFIPPDLAYGDRGAGADIGPSATLVFDVELVSIQAKEAPAPAPGAEKSGGDAVPSTPIKVETQPQQPKVDKVESKPEGKPGDQKPPQN